VRAGVPGGNRETQPLKRPRRISCDGSGRPKGLGAYTAAHSNPIWDVLAKEFARNNRGAAR
jgi:hypothetical protein